MLLLSFNGQTAAVNQDGSLNGPGNPARKSSLVVLYATGEGRVLPDAEDGSITTSPRSPRLPVSVFIDGRPAQVVFAGSAPGIVAGVVQVNAYVPMESRSGAVPVQLRIGDAVSQGNVTLALAP